MNNSKYNLNVENMSHNDVHNTCDTSLPSAKQFRHAFHEHLIPVQNIYTQMAITDGIGVKADKVTEDMSIYYQKVCCYKTVMANVYH